jgi:hypothetical protein
VTELLESTGGIAVVLAVVVLIGFVAYRTFGPQAVGLPAIVGAFALWGLMSAVSNAGLGPIGIVVVAGGVIAVLLIIGMAMRLGDDPSTRSDSNRTGDDSQKVHTAKSATR